MFFHVQRLINAIVEDKPHPAAANTPEGFPIQDLPQRPEEFSPGLTPNRRE